MRLSQLVEIYVTMIYTTQLLSYFSLPFHSEATARDNLPESSLQASLFGESLLIPHRLMHELHNPSICVERLNGLLLMRDEVIASAQAVESLNVVRKIVPSLFWFAFSG